MSGLVVVTGGAYAGKTSVIDRLAARGHPTMAESALEIIDELVAEMGVEAQRAWRRANTAEFQRRITLRQIRKERAARQAGRLVYCDRGALDGKAYCMQAGVAWPDDLEAACATMRYSLVIVLDTLSSFDPRAESGRLDDHVESVEVGALLEEIYAAHAERLVRIPEMPVDRRVEAIIRAQE